MYIKAWRTKRNFADGTRPCCGPVRKAPVSPYEPLCAIFRREPSVLPAFTCESERGAFVREVEKRDEKRFGAAL